MDDAAAGILWIAIAFSGTLALGRTFERERYTDTLRALMLAPADRPAIYVGKLLGDRAAMILAAEALLVPLVGAAVPGAALRASPLLLVAILLAAARSGSRRWDAVRGDAGARAQPRRAAAVLLYPITIPVIIGGVRGTAALLADAGGRADGAVLDRPAGVLRRRVRRRCRSGRSSR